MESPDTLLNAHAAGDPSAMDRLMSLIYEDLRGIAHRHMRREHGGHLLESTALVHEAYLSIAAGDERTPAPKSLVHLLALASRAMRNVLVDHARERTSLKRGGEWTRAPLGDGEPQVAQDAEELLAIRQAVARLAGFDERLARLVELRFFGGMSVRETADHLGVSTMTVTRDWRRARAWLHRCLSETGRPRDSGLAAGDAVGYTRPGC